MLDSVLAPWGRRYERSLRQVWNEFRDESDEVEGPQLLSAALVERVHELGLQPYQAPEPLPMIDEEEVQLVCWMAVVA